MLSYEEFEKYMNLLKAQYSFEKDLDSLCSKYQENTKINGLYYDEVTMRLPSLGTSYIELLSKLMHNKYETIDYFVYELNFGEDWEPNVVQDKDGNDIVLKTVKDLYNLLIEEAKDFEEE